MAGGAEITYFPLRWEEPWLFADVIMREFDWGKWIGVFEEEEVEKKGKTEREFSEGRRSLGLDYKGTPS